MNLTDQEASVKMAEMCGYKQEIHNWCDIKTNMLRGNGKYFDFVEWSPKENIEQAMEVISKFERVLLEKWADLWMVGIHTRTDSYRGEYANLTVAIFESVKKYLQQELK